MRITVLTYLDSEAEAAPDVVVEQVAEALRGKQHEVSILGVHGDLHRLVNGLTRRKPDLVFNLMEMFGDEVTADAAVTGVLDLLDLPYTGGGPGELYLCGDKVVTKKLLAFDGVAYPRFAVFSKQADLETGGNLRMPLFVKPLRLDASIGIDSGGLVHDAIAMMQRALQIHTELNDAALAEEYIDGRELYVGVLGNQEAMPLPPIEIDFSGLPPGAPRVLDRDAKWEPGSAAYQGTKAVVATLPDELRARLQKVALDACRALRVRDYGRVDLRLTDTGDIYVLEVNGNCYLERGSEFAMAAAAAGIDYPDLVQRIADLALAPHAQRKRRPRRRRGKASLS
jgi:D-alanine-D-alanine ligase